MNNFFSLPRGFVGASPRRRRLRLLRRVSLLAFALCGIKVVVHSLHLEIWSLNGLFASEVASVVFLVSFLLSGVLTDFKESEKIPGAISTALETLSLEIQGIPAYNPKAAIDGSLRSVFDLGWCMRDWILEKVSSTDVYASHRRTHAKVVDAATFLSSSTLQGRLMGEMSTLLLLTNRIRVIRQTSFVPLVYWMADLAAFLLCTGLVLARTPALMESLFFLFVLVFLLIFLLRVISDIDNPFSWNDRNSAEQIDLSVLDETLNRLEAALPTAPARGDQVSML